MITIKQIRGGREYFSNHLSANDYYSEGERITGYWQGRLAKALGLEGKPVTREDFESLRSNLHPQTGEKLRQRGAKVTFHDIVISAPKSYSIVALVGGDERLVEGFNRAVDKAFKRLEKMTGARERSGNNNRTENITRTGNGIAAVFKHDTSRLLDPQLHTHLVFSNHTWSEGKKGGGYYALQPKEMMEEAKRWITDQFHRDLAREAIAAGYKAGLLDNRMRVTEDGLKLEYKFSKRARQRRAFERRYRKLFKREPDKKRIEQFIKEGSSEAKKRFKDEYRNEFGRWPGKDTAEKFVKDWRSSKMSTSTRETVYVNQRKELTHYEAGKLDGMVERAREKEQHGQDAGVKENMDAQQDPPDRDEVDRLVGNTNKESSDTKKQKPSRKQKRLQREQYQKTVGRMEAIRRMRRGMAVAQALRGHPMVFMVQQLSTLNRKIK